MWAKRLLRVLSILAVIFLGCIGRQNPAAYHEQSPEAAEGGREVEKNGDVRVFSPGIPTYSFRIIHAFPHDRQAFTQGLLYREGALFESTGLNGLSSLRRVELESGRVLQQIPIAPEYFAEGLALFEDKLYQLTWQSQKLFVYSAQSFELQAELGYTGEGWGLTDDGRFLIMSDGTHQLRFCDPAGFQVKRTVAVLDGNSPVSQLNELEYVKGEIYANVWQTNRIARIEPASGRVSGWIDLTGLLSAADRTGTEDVLNGIAYDRVNDRLFVTGKFWPKLFEIQLVQK